MALRLNVEKITSQIRALGVFQNAGRLVSDQNVLRASISAQVGELCLLRTVDGKMLKAEVIGFDQDHCCLLPLEEGAGFREGADVIPLQQKLRIAVGEAYLGRVIDPLGNCLDGKPAPISDALIPLEVPAPNPLDRPDINQIFVTGQRAIDGFLTLGKGQRVGIFAGSGVGKSTLLGEIAKHSDASINVVVMVGERGREVRPFIEQVLGPQGMQKSIVIVATANQPALARVTAVKLGLAIANWFRSKKQDVLLIVDSLTRLAYAQREIGILLGEPPTSRGFPPSALKLLADLLEPLGRTAEGSITGILTVLVDGDDFNEPVADTVRGILDGHIVLDRLLAEKNHYPAVNLQKSISRLFPDLAPAEQKESVSKIREAISTFEEVEDLVRLGMYQPGASPAIDTAIEMQAGIRALLNQSVNETTPLESTQLALANLASAWVSTYQ